MGIEPSNFHTKHLGLTPTLRKHLQKPITFLLCLYCNYFLPLPKLKTIRWHRGESEPAHIDLKFFVLTPTARRLLLKALSFLSYPILLSYFLFNLFLIPLHKLNKFRWHRWEILKHLALTPTPITKGNQFSIIPNPFLLPSYLNYFLPPPQARNRPESIPVA